VIAGYLGVRHFTDRELGFTSARKYIKNLAENLRHKVTPAREAGSTPETATEHAASL
jgi:hypothetical protein